MPFSLNRAYTELDRLFLLVLLSNFICFKLIYKNFMLKYLQIVSNHN